MVLAERAKRPLDEKVGGWYAPPRSPLSALLHFGPTPQRSVIVLTIELPTDVEDRLDQLAVSTGNTKEFCAQLAIVLHLDDLEDLYISEQRMRDINDGRSKPIPLADLGFD